MTCKKCGAELDENLFCPNCGQTDEENVIQEEILNETTPENNINIESDIADSVSNDDVTVETQAKNETAFSSNSDSVANTAQQTLPLTENTNEFYSGVPKKAKKNTRFIIIIVAAIILVAAAICFLLLKNRGGKTNPYQLFYVKDNSIFVLENHNYEEPLKLADTESDAETAFWSAASAQIRNGVAFFNVDFDEEEGTGTVYYKSVKKDESPVKIDSNVLPAFFNVSEKGDSIVYIKDSNLYINDLKDKEKIASDILSFVAKSDNSAILYSVKDEHSDKFNLYYKNIKDGTDAEKVASNVSEVLNISDDLYTVYYEKDDCIYKYSNGESVKLVSDIYRLETPVDTDEQFYYIKENENKLSYSTYFNDNLAESDAAMKEPNRDDYQETQDFGGYFTYTTTSDAYYDALKEYRYKENRDQFREKLKDKESGYTTYSLYYYDSGAETKVCDDYKSSDSYGNIVVAKIYDPKSKKAVSWDNAEYTYEIYDALNSARNNTLKSVILSSGQIIDTEIKTNETFCYRFNNTENTLYFIASMKKDKNSTYYGTLSKLSPAGETYTVTEITDDVYNYRFISGKLAVIKEKDKTGNGTLYIDDVKISDNVYDLEEKNGKVLVKKDYNSKNKTGSLYLYDKNELIKISDDVYLAGSVSVFENDILYATDYSEKSETVTLNAFTGKESIKVADDVLDDVWSFTNVTERITPLEIYDSVEEINTIFRYDY